MPIQTVLVNDYYPHTNPATDGSKPSRMFDGDATTYYHSRYNSNNPGVKIYFGGSFAVSDIIFIPRLNFYLSSNENTIFTIIKEGGEEEYCGTLTGTNKSSQLEVDQTYKIPYCANKEGVGLKVWKAKGASWCPAEIKISYSNSK